MDQILGGTQDDFARTRSEFEFRGSGSEYFRIWIVNLLLSIVTLGIYSAWAKVRREQYFHRSTLLADSAFEYHGNPIAILKGRLLVVALLFANNVLGQLNPVLAVVIAIAILIATPWIICQAVRFRAWNTSWRGVRLGFVGTYGGVAKVYFLNGLLVLVTLGIAGPWWLNRFQRYIFSNLRFGGQEFNAEPPTWDYYKPLMILFALFVGGAALIGVSAAAMMHGRGSAAGMSSVMVMMVVFYAALYLVGGSFVRARISNALWNHTHLGPHRFESHLRTRTLFGLMLTNALGVVLTLGLFAPFAKVRMAKYRAETLAIESAGSLDAFAAQEEENARAVGEQAAELLDIDLGF